MTAMPRAPGPLRPAAHPRPGRIAPRRWLAAAAVALLLALLVAVPSLAESPGPAAPAPAVAVAPSESPSAGTPPTPAPSAASQPAASQPAASQPAATPQPSPAVSPSSSSAAAAGASPAPCPIPNPTPTPPEPAATARPHNLCPAEIRGADPAALLSWLFTPIFQALFMGLALLYNVFGDIGLAIIGLTILIRLLLVPLFRRQIVSQRRTQLLQPELRSIQAKYKGNRQKISEETMRLYRERGINPVSGCLPAILQLGLLIPMYTVFSQGLSAPDISSMLQILGQPVLNVACQAAGNPDLPCINPTVHWLFNLQANRPEIFFELPVIRFGVSLLAVISALLQVIQTRMTLTQNTADPQARMQQRIFLILPLLSIVYGSFLPAGLFIYWIVTTVFSIVQQFLVAGWGGLFPLFGWTPAFARDHTPRFPVAAAPPPRIVNGNGAEAPPTRRAPADRAAGTIRPARTKNRTSRRGRRR